MVQPYDNPGNLVRFTQPQLLAQSTHLFDWRPDRVHFKSLHGHQTTPAIPGDLISQWTFADPGQVPPAGGEQARMNLWLFRGAAPSNGQRGRSRGVAVRVRPRRPLTQAELNTFINRYSPQVAKVARGRSLLLRGATLADP